jgi:Na+/phosphate symporter
MPLAAKQIKRGVSFSEISWEETHEMIDRLTGKARAAAAVFMTEERGLSGARIANGRRALRTVAAGPRASRSASSAWTSYSI